MTTLNFFRQRIRLIIGGLMFVSSLIGFVSVLVRAPAASPAPEAAVSTPIIVPTAASTAIPTPAPTPLPDADSDGLPDQSDLCPELDDPIQNDLDGDGWGDVCDIDIDGDDLANINDACPFDVGEVCHGPEPEFVFIVNPLVLEDLDEARVSYLELAIFENSEPAHPALLNGVLYPSAEMPLWDDAGDLTLNLIFELQSLSPLWPAADGDLGLYGGGLTLNCPAGDDGLCSGHLNLDLIFDYELATVAPACAPEDARCALSVNAAFGGADSTTVWGAFDAEKNEIHFSAGIPAFPGTAELTDYALDVQFGDGTTMRLGGPLPEIELPAHFDDVTGDCVDLDQQPVECDLMGDLQSVSLDVEIVDDVPFLIVTIESGADLPINRFDDYVRFEVFTRVEEDGIYLVDYYDFFPSDAGGSWTTRRWLHDIDGIATRAVVPAGQTFSSDGNLAILRMPLRASAPRSAVFFSVGAYVDRGQEVLSFDSIRDDAANTRPLLH